MTRLGFSDARLTFSTGLLNCAHLARPLIIGSFLVCTVRMSDANSEGPHLVFFSHWSQIPYFATISRVLKEERQVRTTLWTMGGYAERRGEKTGAFDRIENFLPSASALDVADSEHRSNVGWARDLEERLGTTFFHRDLAQDRYFAGRTMPEIRYEDLPPEGWDERRLYAFMRIVGQEVDDRVSREDVDLMWVEMNSAPYRLARRLCEQYDVPAVHYGSARLWEGRGYLETGLGFVWEECRDTYRQFSRHGIPEHLRQKAEERLNEIWREHSQPTYHIENKRGRKSFWERLDVQQIAQNFQYWWKCLREPWTQNPRHLPAGLFSSWGQIKRYLHSRSSERFYRDAVSRDVDLDRRYAVYFLHVQPEMTVENMAFEYQDQVATIRNLVAGLPADVPLYVKEHKPMVGRRREAFYAELAHIPGVVLVDDTTHSHQYIQNAQVVLTLTGTVGLEAMVYGTPAVAMGDVFYTEFEGIYHTTSIRHAERLLHAPATLEGADRTDVVRMLAALYSASAPAAWPPDLTDAPEGTRDLIRLVESQLNQQQAIEE